MTMTKKPFDWGGLLAIAILIAALSAFIGIPGLWLYACGWKGLFVECRITEQNK